MTEQVEKKILFSQCAYQSDNTQNYSCATWHGPGEYAMRSVFIELRKVDSDLILETIVTEKGVQDTHTTETMKIHQPEYSAIREAIVRFDELLDVMLHRAEQELKNAESIEGEPNQ